MISAWWLLAIIPVAVVSAGVVFLFVAYQVSKGLNR